MIAYNPVTHREIYTCTKLVLVMIHTNNRSGKCCQFCAIQSINNMSLFSFNYQYIELITPPLMHNNVRVEIFRYNFYIFLKRFDK